MVLDPTKFILPNGAPVGGQQPCISAPIGPADTALVGTPITAVQVLDANELADQEPAVEDVPLQVTFGPAQNGPGDPIQLLADGTIQVNQAGTYVADFFFMFGRQGGGQSALVGFRSLVNGTQSGETVNVAMDSDDQSIPYSFFSVSPVPAGTLITNEVVRDSGGPNDGGLIALPSSAPGWNPSVSASVRIWQLLNG